MRAIICKSEEEFEQYEKLAADHLGLPSKWHQEYSRLDEDYPVFPVIKEVEHLFSAKQVVEYTPDEDDG